MTTLCDSGSAWTCRRTWRSAIAASTCLRRSNWPRTRGRGLSRAVPKSRPARGEVERGGRVHEPGDPSPGQGEDRTLPRAGRIAQDLPPSTGRDPAPGAAHARQRGRGAAGAVRTRHWRWGLRVFDPHQRRHSLADDQIVERRGSAPRPVGLHQIPRAAESRRSQARHGRVLRRLQNLRAHARCDALLAAERGFGVREGAQIPRFDHPRARRQPAARRGVRHADQGDQCEPADAASLFSPARQNPRRSANAVLRHLSAAGAQRYQVSARGGQEAGAGGDGAARQRLRCHHGEGIQQSLDGRLSRARTSSRARTWPAPPTTCIPTC